MPSSLLALADACAQENVQITKQGVVVEVGPAQIELAPASDHALRLSVAYFGRPAFAHSSLLADLPTGNAIAWQLIRENGLIGIKTKAGQLLVDPRDGTWILKNAGRQVLISKCDIGNLDTATAPGGRCVKVTVGRDPNMPLGVYGCGNGNPTLFQTNASTHVDNGVAVIPYYWSPEGYAVLAVSANDNSPASWKVATNGDGIIWNFPGTTADLYLMPAATLKAAASDYDDLTGHAPVPPKWAFGYLQSRWGWKDRAYIEDTLKEFHDRRIPLDAFIFDFEWYTTKPDYELTPAGTVDFSDFGWNTNLFSEPAMQLKTYLDAGIHFVGIRKPRLGNTSALGLIRKQGWDLHLGEANVKSHFESRDVDFASRDFRAWYINQTTNLLAQGVDGWWNDEGEGSFTTYYYWNLAEADALAQVEARPPVMDTLTGHFLPVCNGWVQAHGPVTIRSTWDALAGTPTGLLNWGSGRHAQHTG